MTDPETPGKFEKFRHRLHEIIFEADTFTGKIFDTILLLAIIASVILLCIESMILNEPPPYRLTPQEKNVLFWLDAAEWVFTILFTVEYVLRLISVKRPLKYAFSFFGIVDLLAFLPVYVAYFVFAHGSSLGVIRALRLLRVFRVFKLVWLMSEAEDLWNAVWQSRGKVVVFVGVVFIAVAVAGAAMYEIEGPVNGFESIPLSMYWATVTMTTVGYGDIVPQTAAGKTVATVLILLGYSLIIVPTGFVSAEIASYRLRQKVTTQACPSCMREGHENDAIFCKFCGERLNP